MRRRRRRREMLISVECEQVRWEDMSVCVDQDEIGWERREMTKGEWVT